MTLTSPSTQSLPVGLLRSMRPQQWTKNVLVFAAPVAAGVIRDRSILWSTIVAFVAFCLAASATYLLNDVRDIESDRRHPTKRNRAIPSGVVPVPVAVGTALVLIVAALGLGLAINRNLFLSVLAYLALTFAYVYWLKYEAVVDVVAVAAGYVVRTIAGATAASVPISPWFFVVTSFGALLMVAGKREGESSELAGDAGAIRKTLGVYTPSYLSYLRSVASGVVLVAYCLWAFESAGAQPVLGITPPPQVSDASGTLFKLSIIPFVIAILRYALLLDQGEGSEPEKLIFSDRTLQIAGIVWAVTYASGVYLNR
jgi:decaprenyl-phosphate phosphoribosyltransferase